MWKVRIAGVGSYLPERVVTSEELETRWNLTPGWIQRVTGICERRYVTGETSVQMADWAAQKALDQAGIAAEDIGLILGASVTPYQTIPCTAAFVQRELGIAASGCPCFDVNATCLSFLFALHTAAHFIHSGAYRHILIFSSEVTTHSLNASEPESAALFGDAAAAIVLTAASPEDPACLWDAQFATDSEGAELTQLRGGGSRYHPNDPQTGPEINQFTMQGPKVFRQAARQLSPFLDAFFTRLNWDRVTVDAVVPHQASQHGLSLLTGRLGFQPDQIVSNLAVRGNCGGASIPLLLTESVASGRIRRGQRLVLLGTGAGFSMGVIALTF